MQPIEIIINGKSTSATDALKRISDQLKKTGQDALDFKKGFDFAGVLGQAAGFGLAQIGIAALSDAVSVGKSAFIDYNAVMEQNTVAFKNMLGSAEAAQYFLSQMKDFADKTPFEFPEVAMAAKKFMAFGFAAKDVIPTLTALGDAAAGLSVGSAGIDRMVLALGQMRAKGKVSGEELMQLNELGINAAQILRDAFGQSVEEIQKSGKNIDEVITALVNGIGVKYKGLMAEQSQTFTGLMSTIKDQSGTILGFVGEPIFESAKTALKGISDSVGELSKAINTGDFSKLFDSFSPEFQQILIEAYDVFGKFGPTFNELSQAAGQLYDSLLPVGKFLGEGLLIAATGFLDAFRNGIDFIVEATTRCSEWLGELSVEIEQYTGEWWDDFVETIGNLPEFFAQTWEDITSDIGYYFDTMFDYPLRKIQEFADEAKYTLKGIKDWIPFLKEEEKAQLGSVFTREEFKNNEFAQSIDISSVLKAENDRIKKEIEESNKKFFAAWDAVGPLEPEDTRSNLVKAMDANKAKRDALLAKGKIGVDANKASKITSSSSSGGKEGRGREHFIDFDEIIEREREAMASLQNEAKLATAKMVGDKKWQAETEYEIAISNIEKEYFRKQEITEGNFEAEAALQEWYDAKSLELFQEKTNKIKDTELEAFDKRIEQNNLLFDLDKATKEEISRLNRQVLDEKIANLQTELATEALTVDREIELQKQLADAKKKALVLPQNEQEAFYSGIKQQTDTWNTYFQDIQNIGKAAAQGLNDAFSDFFFDAMTGQLKSLGDYFKSFLQSIARAISQMMANAFAQKIIGSLFSGFGLPGKAVGGPVNYGQPYMVGERGPELFVPQSAGSIVPNHAIGSNAGVNVVVNVQNNTGTQVEPRTEAKFDGSQYVIDIVIDALARDRGGMRTLVKGMR